MAAIVCDFCQTMWRLNLSRRSSGKWLWRHLSCKEIAKFSLSLLNQPDWIRYWRISGEKVRDKNWSFGLVSWRPRKLSWHSLRVHPYLFTRPTNWVAHTLYWINTITVCSSPCPTDTDLVTQKERERHGKPNKTYLSSFYLLVVCASEL